MWSWWARVLTITTFGVLSATGGAPYLRLCGVLTPTLGDLNPDWGGLISDLRVQYSFTFSPRGNPFWTKRGPFSWKKGVSGFHLASFSSFFPFHPRGNPFWTKRGPFSSKKGVSGFMLAFPCLSFLFTLWATLFEQNEVRFPQKKALSFSRNLNPFRC